MTNVSNVQPGSTVQGRSQNYVIRGFATQIFAVVLRTVRHPAVVLAPRRFSNVAQQVRTCDVMVVAHLAAPESGEVFLRHVGAGPVRAVGELVIDTNGPAV